MIADKITQLTQKSNIKNNSNDLPICKFSSRYAKPSNNAPLTNKTILSQVSDHSSNTSSSAEMISASAHSKVSAYEVTTNNNKTSTTAPSNNLNNYRNVTNSRNTTTTDTPGDCEKIEKLKLAVETTTTMISLNIDESKQESTVVGPTAVLSTLPAVTSASNVANTTNEEINDSYVMITKSVLMNQFSSVEDVLNNESTRVAQKNIGSL